MCGTAVLLPQRLLAEGRRRALQCLDALVRCMLAEGALPEIVRANAACVWARLVSMVRRPHARVAPGADGHPADEWC